MVLLYLITVLVEVCGIKYVLRYGFLIVFMRKLRIEFLMKKPLLHELFLETSVIKILKVLTNPNTRRYFLSAMVWHLAPVILKFPIFHRLRNLKLSLLFLHQNCEF